MRAIHESSWSLFFADSAQIWIAWWKNCFKVKLFWCLLRLYQASTTYWKKYHQSVVRQKCCFFKKAITTIVLPERSNYRDNDPRRPFKRRLAIMAGHLRACPSEQCTVYTFFKDTQQHLRAAFVGRNYLLSPPFRDTFSPLLWVLRVVRNAMSV